MSDMLKIGNVSLDNHIIVGPMAGISNSGFRGMIKNFHPGLIYTEMVSDKAICYSSKKTLEMTHLEDGEGPISLQLFGHDLETMVKATRYLSEETDCAIVDINMGCPVPKVVNNNGGSALMKEPEHAYEIVREISKAIEKPLTVKIRAGWDHDSINCVEMAQGLEKAGAQAICLHPRTRSEYYGGHSNWDLIRQVKEKVSIPVIGNGDIKTVYDYLQMKRQTGCDGFMISRGCLGNPWLIQQLVHYEKTGERLPEPDYHEKIAQCLIHGQRLVALKGENIAIKEMRGHACWYITGLPYNNRVKDLINNMTTYQQLDAIMKGYEKAVETEDYSDLIGGIL